MKRLWCTVILVCLLAPLVFTVPVSAAMEWTYNIYVTISDKKDAGCGKKNAIQVTLTFDGTDEQGYLQNTGSRGGEADLTIKSSRAPWTLDSVKFENMTKDSLWMYKVYIDVQPSTTGSRQGILLYYYGDYDNDSTGAPIDIDDGGPKSRTIYFDPGRKLSQENLDDFSDKLSKDIRLDPKGESGTITNEWSGKISDNYSDTISKDNKYYCLDLSDAPTLSVSVSGMKGDGSQTSKTELEKNGMTFTEKGYTVDKAKLLTYMNNNNLNEIDFAYTLQFSSKSTNGLSTFYGKTRIFRNAFSLKNISLSSKGGNFYKASNDNYFYNNAMPRTITVTANIAATDNYNMFSGGALNESKISFDRAYLKAGDKEFPAKDNAGKKQNDVTVNSGTIQMMFPYDENIDSDNKGITLVLENARIEKDGITYRLWDETNKKLGLSNQGNFDGYYIPTHKIDSKPPTVMLAPAEGTDLSKWNKTVTLTSTPSEDIYTYPVSVQKLTQGFYNMSLMSGTNRLSIYKYNYTEQNKGAASTIQSVPALKGYTQNITLALRDNVEGEYTLVLAGRDRAGNPLSVSYSGIKLDNKAPEVTVAEKQKPKTDGRKGNIYNVTISDASGTGRLYYMFTKRSVADAPEYDGSNNPSVSGDMDTTLDRWAYIEQKDIESGKTAAAYLDVEKGQNFIGRLMYFAIDEAGNKTKVCSKDININNEDTTYDITPKNVDKPRSSYNISVTTNGNNTVYYRWISYVADEASGTLKEVEITKPEVYNGSIDTSKNEATKNLNGTYVLECKIVPPSNKNGKTVYLDYAFDNEGPSINITAPPENSISRNQTISVYVTDMSDVLSAAAKIVTPDGKDIEGNEEFALSVTDGIVSQNVNISEIPSGSYALKVTAVDKNNIESSEISAPFVIRSSAPNGTVNVSSNLTHNGKPLISDDILKLDFDITENFLNPSYAKAQSLYYRISTTAEEYGEWIKAKEMTSSGNEFKVKEIADNVPKIALIDGVNTLFVQTAVYCDDADKAKIDLNTVKNDEVIFYYDKTAPTADLIIDDIHTKDSIEGKLYVKDNLDTALTAICDSSAVKIGELKDGAFDITVSENVDTTVTVSDASGNKTDVKLVINGIDKTAPKAEIKASEKMSGARKDALATVTINDVSGESVRFAFIPCDKYNGGEIPEEFFADALDGTNYYKISESRSEAAFWDGEYNITYNVEISGISGKWYLGVRASDSLGNSGDTVFNNDVLSAEDTELSAELSVKPLKTETKTVASVRYNVPVYTLPQDRIVDADSDIVKNNTLLIDDFDKLNTRQKVEAANLELAKQYAVSYSGTYTFAVSENGDYDLYTVDDLGRTKHLSVTVSGVEFGAASDIKADVYKKVWTEEGNYTYVKAADGEAVCAASYGENAVIVEPRDGSGDTLLLPNEENKDINTVVYKNGLLFDEAESKAYAVYEDGESGAEDEPDYAERTIKGYTKLVYTVHQIMLNNEGSYDRAVMLSDETERIIAVRAFNKDADTQNPDEVSEKIAVINGIDNTEPIVTWSASPKVLTYDRFETNGEIYYDWVVHTTPGNVTYTLTAQDKESGINRIVALSYDGEGGSYEEVEVPLTDENGNPTEYWSWDGSEHNSVNYVWNEETQDYTEVFSPIPVKVEYYGDGDIYGVKTLRYTFTEAYRLEKAGQFVNTLGARGFAYIGPFEGGLSTEGIIYKIPIEEGKDYNVRYYFENSEGVMEEITDNENVYYKNAKAVIEIPEGSRGEERGLYILNNSGKSEKALNNYSNAFTFRIKDKYGYTKDVSVSLDNFDIEPGTIDYSLETTAKTNKPYDITVNVSDAKSGIGTVKLTNGEEDVTLSKISEGTYSGKIAQNGMYSITLYDNAGNKAVKSFNVTNINTTVPEASVSYSTKDYTSRPVTAALSFSKPNVRITNISPVAPLTEADYSVNYNTSVITFTKSGTVAVCFTDDYGNSNADDLLLVAVNNIDKTPPLLTAVTDNVTDPSVVSVSFDKIDSLTSEMDMARKESEIYVTYGGITKTVADADGKKNSFTFYQNGNYTFKVYDKEGLSSYLSLEIDDIDTKAPKITSVSWSYDYDEYDDQNQSWVTKTVNETRVPNEGSAGYVVASDDYKVTNKDVTVTVKTDDDTKLVGGEENYTDTKEKVYDRNGLFIFNTEKKNGLTASYGVDIEVIDKTPPTIDLLEKTEMVFYENPEMNTAYDISMLKYVENGPYEAYKAYDVFGGKKTNLTSAVQIDWGGFNPYDLSQNTFDSTKPYTITYRVTDSANNVREVKRTVRLVGMYDTIALVNGSLPDFAGRSEVLGDSIKISLANFSGIAYVRYQSGVKTMGQMKKDGIMLSKNANGKFEISGLSEGWYTFYIQTDKRDYFTLCVYLSK